MGKQAVQLTRDHHEYSIDSEVYYDEMRQLFKQSEHLASPQTGSGSLVGDVDAEPSDRGFA